jgi:hypothetical protein
MARSLVGREGRGTDLGYNTIFLDNEKHSGSSLQTFEEAWTNDYYKQIYEQNKKNVQHY